MAEGVEDDSGCQEVDSQRRMKKIIKNDIGIEWELKLDKGNSENMENNSKNIERAIQSINIWKQYH